MRSLTMAAPADAGQSSDNSSRDSERIRQDDDVTNLATAGGPNRDIARIQGQFSAEAIDTDWQITAQHDLNLFAQREGLTLHDVSCKSTLCKVEIQLPEDKTIEDVITRFGSSLPWAASIAVSESLGSHASTIEAFFQRKK